MLSGFVLLLKFLEMLFGFIFLCEKTAWAESFCFSFNPESLEFKKLDSGLASRYFIGSTFKGQDFSQSILAME
jgi:hypothetical protein